MYSSIDIWPKYVRDVRIVSLSELVVGTFLLPYYAKIKICLCS